METSPRCLSIPGAACAVAAAAFLALTPPTHAAARTIPDSHGRPSATSRPASSSPSRPAKPANMDALSLGDVTRLLREGVGGSIVIRQIRRYGVDFEPTVEAILRLRRAGATDDVLDAVLDAAEGRQPARGAAGRGSAAADRSTDGPSVASAASKKKPDRVLAAGDIREEDIHFRMYEMSDTRGRSQLVLTNLDDEGRRLGGEAPNHQEANVVLSPDLPESDPWERPERRARHAVRIDTGDGFGGETVVQSEGGADGESTSPVTVIIQNGTGAAAPQQPAVVPAYGGGCGWGGCGGWFPAGIVGGFKYPDKHFFLGYDPRNTVNVAPAPAPQDIRIAQPPPRGSGR